MSNIEAIEILKKDMDRIITLNNGGNIEKEFDLYQAEALAIQALENIKVEVITMTSYEFEKAAKNAVIQTLNENISINQLDLVWFAHELGYKKCTIWGQPMGNRYAEVTYNRDKDEMYVDIYQKIINNKISSDEFNFEA